MSGPRAYLIEKPNSQSILFGGRYINLSLLAADGGFDHSYLSRILSGERVPTIDYGKRIAKELEMGFEDFLQCCQDRKEAIREEHLRRIA